MTRVNESLQRRLTAWLLTHPSEWLTVEDVMAKFSVSHEYARKALSDSTHDGRIKRFSVYGAAPQQNSVSSQVSAEVSKP